MKLLDLKKLVAVSALGLTVVLGTTMAANAQNNNWKKNQKEQQKAAQQQAKWEQQRQQDEMNRRRGQVGNNDRYRVYRNGRYYNTDSRGANLLRQAVNQGYQQGFTAGRADRNSRRRMSWTNSNVYRSGTYGWQNSVDRSQYQYYFQQGFQRGYQDGYNSRYQYGSNSGGSVNILGSILNSILNIQNY